MTTLANYPNLSQLSAKTNGPDDCVVTSLIDGLEYLTGQHFDIDTVMNAVYGPNYHGFTSAQKFVSFCATHGVKLYAIDANNATLVQDIHDQIKLLHPVLITEPDVYAPLHPTWSHVLSMYREDPGTLTARDPYSTKDVTHTDPEWQFLLQFREIWVLERIEQDMPTTISITTPGISAWFKEIDADHWQCLKNGFILQGDNLKWYKENGTVPYCGLSSMGLILSNEIPIEQVGASLGYPFAHLAGKGIKAVYGERQNIVYDPKHEFDAPPGAGATYPTKLLGSNSINPALWDAQAQLTKAGTPDPLTPEYKAALKTVITAVEPLVGKV